MSKGFTCECGQYHAFPMYVFAHAHVPLVHTCKYCGRKHEMQNLEVWLIEEPNEQGNQVRGRRTKRNSAGR
jgi:hypothetical protein